MAGESTIPIDDGRARGDGPPPRPHLFVVLQCQRPLQLPARFAMHHLDEVVIGRDDARVFKRTNDGGVRRLRISLPDPTMSSTHAKLVQAFGRWMIEDAGSRNGTIVGGEKCNKATLTDGVVVELGHTLFVYRNAIPTPIDEPLDHDPAVGTPPPTGLETLLPTLSSAFAKLARAAASTLPIVLKGETGVGKEVLARAVHQASGRGGRFVPVNCGALPKGLVESELFGHQKGAFTGADEAREGLVRAADGGTLFLDEIGDLDRASQVALLRVLQEHEVRPVGGTRVLPVDLRVIAATHRELTDLVAAGTFRDDLHARLMGFTMRLPPLRERREDLGLLVARLLERLGAPPDISFSLDAARALCRHRWPMNIRELERVLSAGVVLAGADPIEVEHLPIGAVPEAAGPALSPKDFALRTQLLDALREHGGNISAVARSFGKARVQVQRWLKRFDLDADDFR